MFKNKSSVLKLYVVQSFTSCKKKVKKKTLLSLVISILV